MNRIDVIFHAEAVIYCLLMVGVAIYLYYRIKH